MIKLNENVDFSVLQKYGFDDVAEFHYEFGIKTKSGFDRITINKITRELTYNDENDDNKLLENDIVKKMQKDSIIYQIN